MSRRTYEITQRPTPDGEWSYRSARWSPRGDVLAIEFYGDDVAEILLFYVDDKTTERMDCLGSGSGGPRWNRAGNLLCFTPSLGDPEKGLCRYDIDRKELFSLLEDRYVGDCVPLGKDHLLVLQLMDACPNDQQQCLVLVDGASAKGAIVGRWSAKERRILPISKVNAAPQTDP